MDKQTLQKLLADDILKRLVQDEGFELTDDGFADLLVLKRKNERILYDAEKREVYSRFKFEDGEKIMIEGEDLTLYEN